MKSKPLFSSALGALLLLSLSGCALQHGVNLRADDEKIEKWLLVQTPKGTEMSEVLAYTKDRGWYGRMNQGKWKALTRSEFIIRHLGDYRSSIHRTSVQVAWEFENGRLVNVLVGKSTTTF